MSLPSGVITYWVELAHIELALIPDGTYTDPQQITTNTNESNQYNQFSVTLLSTSATDPPNSA